VIENEGAVWFGKMGQPISQNAIDKLNQQVKDNIPKNQSRKKKKTSFRLITKN